MWRMFSPSFEEFKHLAQSGNLIPVAREILADLETPVSAFLKLRDGLKRESSTRLGDDYVHPRTPSFLLESVEGGENVARYSFLGVGARAELITKNDEAILRENGTERHISLSKSRDPLHIVEEILQRFRFVPVAGLPRFCGGIVGFLGYDLVRFFENLPDAPQDDRELPDCHLILTDTVLVFDNVRHSIKVLNNAFLESDDEASLQKAYDESCDKIDRVLSHLTHEVLAAKFLPIARERKSSTRSLDDELPPSNFAKREDFEDAVTKCIEYIHAGDCVQVVPSQRFQVPLKASTFGVYRALRHVNPSPYMFYLELGETTLIGASPEILVTEDNGVVSTRPLAGTRRRGTSAEEDEQLEAELLADPKDRSEHIMLVDLHRNDIGRVCEYGSVEVDELMVVEKYSHVMHIVSNVIGKLRPDKTAFDLLRASFPAGTLSGAPKVRAMQIIDELEPTRRGPYGGAIGYFSFSGNLDTCITLRTIIVKNDIAYVQAGGGVVADSVPADEYEETCNKARAALRAIALAETAES